MQRKRPLPFLVVLAFLLPMAAEAQAVSQGPSSGLRVGVSYFDLDGSAGAAALELTYRHGSWRVWRMEPQVGAMFNVDGGVYGYGGIAMPLETSHGFGVTPSLSIGGYRQGGSLDLGQVLEFRSGIQLTLPGWDDDRITVLLYHLSNAGLGERNPGTEVLGVGYLLRW